MLIALTMTCLLLSPLPDQSGGQASPTPDPWAPLRPMVGTWRSTSTGQPGDGTGERMYALLQRSSMMNGRRVGA